MWMGIPPPNSEVVLKITHPSYPLSPRPHTKFLGRSPGPQLLASGVCRWGLWEVSRSGGWSPHYGISALKRRDKKAVISLHHVRAQQEGERKEREGSPHQTWNLSAPWSWTCSSQSCEKSIHCFSPSAHGILLQQPTLTNTCSAVFQAMVIAELM